MLLMKKESLLDNIGGYEKILDKIREYVSIDCENDKTIDEMREEIRNIIYMKNAWSLNCYLNLIWYVIN